MLPEHYKGRGQFLPTCYSYSPWDQLNLSVCDDVSSGHGLRGTGSRVDSSVSIPAAWNGMHQPVWTQRTPEMPFLRTESATQAGAS